MQHTSCIIPIVSAKAGMGQCCWEVYVWCNWHLICTLDSPLSTFKKNAGVRIYLAPPLLLRQIYWPSDWFQALVDEEPNSKSMQLKNTPMLEAQHGPSCCHRGNSRVTILAEVQCGTECTACQLPFAHPGSALTGEPVADLWQSRGHLPDKKVLHFRNQSMQISWLWRFLIFPLNLNSILPRKVARTQNTSWGRHVLPVK